MGITKWQNWDIRYGSKGKSAMGQAEISRHSSLSSAGGNGGPYHGYEMGLDKLTGEEVSIDSALHKAPTGNHGPILLPRNRVVRHDPSASAISSKKIGQALAYFLNETSFMDVLKKPVITEAEAANCGTALESSDGPTESGRSREKEREGKEANWILLFLGFQSFSSNRINGWDEILQTSLRVTYDG
ncbi:hypothetical protein NC652_004855 [Populus alba x Populus x berolinensis]|nr:hypothetical protein NC652_004855 [Populus alba x Populus x berolinensis]